jgi:hypothetical protein
MPIIAVASDAYADAVNLHPELPRWMVPLMADGLTVIYRHFEPHHRCRTQTEQHRPARYEGHEPTGGHPCHCGSGMRSYCAPGASQPATLH